MYTWALRALGGAVCTIGILLFGASLSHADALNSHRESPKASHASVTITVKIHTPQHPPRGKGHCKRPLPSARGSNPLRPDPGSSRAFVVSPANKQAHQARDPKGTGPHSDPSFSRPFKVKKPHHTAKHSGPGTTGRKSVSGRTADGTGARSGHKTVRTTHTGMADRTRTSHSARHHKAAATATTPAKTPQATKTIKTSSHKSTNLSRAMRPGTMTKSHPRETYVDPPKATKVSHQRAKASSAVTTTNHKRHKTHKSTHKSGRKLGHKSTFASHPSPRRATHPSTHTSTRTASPKAAPVVKAAPAAAKNVVRHPRELARGAIGQDGTLTGTVPRVEIPVNAASRAKVLDHPRSASASPPMPTISRARLISASGRRAVMSGDPVGTGLT